MRPAADRHATGVFGKRYQYNCCVSYPVRIGRAEVFGAKFLAELAPPIYVVAVFHVSPLGKVLHTNLMKRLVSCEIQIRWLLL